MLHFKVLLRWLAVQVNWVLNLVKKTIFIFLPDFATSHGNKISSPATNRNFSDRVINIGSICISGLISWHAVGSGN